MIKVINIFLIWYFVDNFLNGVLKYGIFFCRFFLNVCVVNLVFDVGFIR